MKITIKPRPDASRRTKNRIAENGQEFSVRKHRRFNIDGEGPESVLLDALATTWFGWVPVEEIEIMGVKLKGSK